MRPAPCGINRRIDSAVTLLPHPDSPTMQSVSPRLRSNDTPSTARTTPSRVKNCVAQISYREDDVVPRRAGVCIGGFRRHAVHMRRAMRGSSVSRKPSPTRLIASTVMASSRPGKKMIQGAIWKNVRPSAMTLPQLGISGGVPAPRNDRPASVRIAEAQTIGRLHDQRRHRVRQDVAQHDLRIARAAGNRRLDIGAGRARTARRCARGARTRGTLGIEMATMTMVRLAFISVMSAIASRMAGIAIMPSMMRMTNASTRR